MVSEQSVLAMAEGMWSQDVKKLEALIRESVRESEQRQEKLRQESEERFEKLFSEMKNLIIGLKIQHVQTMNKLPIQVSSTGPVTQGRIYHGGARPEAEEEKIAKSQVSTVVAEGEIQTTSIGPNVATAVSTTTVTIPSPPLYNTLASKAANGTSGITSSVKGSKSALPCSAGVNTWDYTFSKRQQQRDEEHNVHATVLTTAASSTTKAILTFITHCSSAIPKALGSNQESLDGEIFTVIIGIKIMRFSQFMLPPPWPPPTVDSYCVRFSLEDKGF